MVSRHSDPCDRDGRGAVRVVRMKAHAYRIVALAERTPQWWTWRQAGVGSSDAPTILGAKPAKSVERLRFEKQHPPKDSGRSFLRAQGVARERAARTHYCIAAGLTVEPACVESIMRPWQRASLDGLSVDGERVVEIKCGRATCQQAAARGRPARHHFAQLQHILAVTGLPVVDYWCYCPPIAPLRLEVRRDEAYIERLVAAEETFWKNLAPPRDIAIRGMLPED